MSNSKEIKLKNEYTYYDFFASLNDIGQLIVEALYKHISENHPEYKPYGVLPKNKDKKEWSLYFRKYPKHGKPLCALFSKDGALSIRCTFFSPMIHELLLRQDEFGENIRAKILRVSQCEHCGQFGDKQFCWLQHHFFVNERFSWMCNSAWFEINNIADGDLNDKDINDLLYLLDLHSKHMAHSEKETRGAGFDEENLLRCGNVASINLKHEELDIDDFNPADYADIKRLDKYTKTYNLTPMGANDGLWFYFDDKGVCGTPNDGYSFTSIPEGGYATVTISNPFAFSVIRAWDYICLWVRKNKLSVVSTDIGGVNTSMLVKFYKQGANQFMEMYVPIK